VNRQACVALRTLRNNLHSANYITRSPDHPIIQSSDSCIHSSRSACVGLRRDARQAGR
jgi:hypothetical protein